MDLIDRKILHSISENARESHNVLARKIRCSREVLDYRLRRLEKEGIISGYQARLCITNFIHASYILLVQTLGLNKEKLAQVINKLKINTQTQYIAKMGGDYDLLISFTTKSLNQLSSYIDFVNSIFGQHKTKTTMLTMVQEWKDSFKSLFSENDERNNIVSMPKIEEKIDIDEEDKEILLSLGNDATQPSWKISDKLNITDVAVRKRISNLEKKKIILGYRTMLKPDKLNLQAFHVFLRTNFENTKQKNDFIDKLLLDKKITYVMQVVGLHDFLITVFVKDNIELSNYLASMREQFSDNITEANAVPLLEIVYHTQLTKNLLE